MTVSVVRIGTRASELALRQAREVLAAIQKIGVAGELVTYTTTGDRILDRPLSAIGTKGLFTAELESDLLTGKIDCAVHSLKDLPTADAPGLRLVAMLEREDPRDALVVSDRISARSLAELPSGTRVGTSSLRRRAQLIALRPDLEVCDLRGNVGTRLRKVDEGEVDAALLAAAGLRRLHLGHRIVQSLDAPEWIAAPGQGTIAVQSRAPDSGARSDADSTLYSILAQLDDADARMSAGAERALLASLEGGCQVPIGAACIRGSSSEGLTMHAVVASTDGSRTVRGSIHVNKSDPASSGRELGLQLRAAGGDAILESLRTSSGAVGHNNARIDSLSPIPGSA